MRRLGDSFVRPYWVLEGIALVFVMVAVATAPGIYSPRFRLPAKRGSTGCLFRWTSTAYGRSVALLLRITGTADPCTGSHFGLLLSAFLLFAFGFWRSNLPGAVWLLLLAACSPAILNFIGVL